MTNVTSLIHPELFAAASPNNGAGALSKKVTERVALVKAKQDYRMPVMAVYGAVDSSASVDGKIAAGGPVDLGIQTLKKYNHISTKDLVEPCDTVWTTPYEVLMLAGRAVPAGIDKRYPAGRFQRYEYMSDDAKPLNLLQVVWVSDLPHAYDLREAQLEWSTSNTGAGMRMGRCLMRSNRDIDDSA